MFSMIEWSYKTSSRSLQKAPRMSSIIEWSPKAPSSPHSCHQALKPDPSVFPPITQTTWRTSTIPQANPISPSSGTSPRAAAPTSNASTGAWDPPSPMKWASTPSSANTMAHKASSSRSVPGMTIQERSSTLTSPLTMASSRPSSVVSSSRRGSPMWTLSPRANSISHPRCCSRQITRRGCLPSFVIPSKGPFPSSFTCRRPRGSRRTTSDGPICHWRNGPRKNGGKTIGWSVIWSPRE
mmetsp:Transcript_15890/g.30014  ORF Transcript_15890/g.30014 Transcript_15890/m.30014 type:complete len:239 (+) Transcript_15890:337-1053(+)